MEKRAPRLQFTKEEQTDPVLKKSVRREQKAAVKADRAQAKVPKKTALRRQPAVDPATGKVTTRLKFEEVDKKKPSKLTHAVRDAPGNAVLMQFHREIRQSEDENVGVEAAHKSEEATETGGRLVRSAHRSRKLARLLLIDVRYHPKRKISLRLFAVIYPRVKMAPKRRNSHLVRSREQV